MDESDKSGSIALFVSNLRNTVLVQHERHIGDFTNWTDSQAYGQAFEQLLRALKAQE